MAIQGPVGKENMDISLRLQRKPPFFDASSNALLGSKCNLVASASCYGIVFVGSSNAELLVACLKDLETEAPLDADQSVPIRKVPLPAQTTQIATNCDGSILAVASKLNGTPHIQLYSVASFLTPNVQKLREFRLSADNSDALQLCWNPVMSGILAVCTESGGLNTYTLKADGLEFHSIDPNLKAKCCCWSPKGKQIVVGFANGKLMQFTPELKPAKTIECPGGIVNGTFDTIAIQWLSTFQFAVAFLSHQPESRPILHIVNAPKAGPPQYIAYNDVCFSSTDSRPCKIYLQHILQWNILLIASANSIDISILRISQTGDLPIWTQEFFNDSYPAELPLTKSQDESFPLGFEIDTGCTNRLQGPDHIPYPVMPMIHILTTSGVLCSFYVLNTTQSYVDICSPPRPLDANSLSLFKAAPITSQEPEMFRTPPKVDMTFTPPIGQSTPAIPKIQPMATKAPSTNSFFGLQPTLGNPSQPPSAFGQNTNLTSAFQSVAKTTAASIAPQPNLTQTQPATALITLQPNYAPATVAQSKVTATVAKPVEKPNTAEDEQIYSRMIQDEIRAFELELKTVMERSRSLKVNIGTKDESAEMRRSIEKLDELKKEATETIESLRSDVQSNRLGITDMFSMVYEARAKFDQSKNEKSIFMHQSNTQDRASKRTLDRLVKQLSQCEMQLQAAIQVMNSQWADYQEAISKSKKNRMHNPSLEGLYQTLTKQQEIIYRQSEKMAMLKSKLGLRDNMTKQKSIANTTIDSFADSMIAMSLADQVESENSKLTNKKLKNLRNLLANREVVIIKPQRPERVGLSSEIIREKKLQTVKALKKRQIDEVTSGSNQSSSSAAFQTSVPTFNQPSAPAAPQNIFNLSSDQQKNLGFGSSAPAAPQNIFNLSSDQQKILGFGSSAAPVQMPFSKRNDEPVKSTTFGGFGAPTTQASSFGLNLLSGNPMQQPSFGLSTSLVLEADKKKADSQAPRLYINPVAHKTASDIAKPASTIANANVSSTATFTIPLANKVTPSAQKDQSRVVEKVQDENKPPPSSENASFTFKLADKKDDVVTIRALPGTPNFASLLPGTTESPKDFSFASNPIAKGEAKSVQSSAPASVFSGFGSASTTSVFGGSTPSGFGTSFLNSGSDAAKPPSGFSINLVPTSDSTKNTSTAGSFSFASLSTSLSTDAKATPTDLSTIAKTQPSTASSFSFSSSIAAQTTAKVTEASTVPSTFSFASLGSSIAPTPVSVESKPDGQPTLTPPASSLSTQSSIESILQGTKVCSPEVKNVAQSPPANIFGSGSIAKTETTSIFGSSSFGSSLGGSSTQTSIFGSQSSSSPVATAVVSPVATSTGGSSVFGVQTTQVTSTTATSPSIFGSLSLNTSEANKTSPTSPPTGLFSSLVKPDQSVFGQISPTSQTPTSPFGGIFSQAANQSPSVFGSQAAPSQPSTIFGAPPTPTSPGSLFNSAQPASTQANIFGGAQQGSMFGQTSNPSATGGGSLFSQSSFAAPATTAPSGIFGAAQASAATPFGAAPSVFGSTQSPPQSSTGSIFGNQSSFGSQPTTGNIFGGSSTINAPSPFGASSVFGGPATFSNTFGGVGQSGFSSSAAPGTAFNQQPSSFGGNPTFGGQATFGSPKSSSIFGQAQTTGQSNTLFEQLGSQQSGNLFGNLAQNTQQPQQPPPQQTGFSGSAFSSWR